MGGGINLIPWGQIKHIAAPVQQLGNENTVCVCFVVLVFSVFGEFCALVCRCVLCMAVIELFLCLYYVSVVLVGLCNPPSSGWSVLLQAASRRLCFSVSVIMSHSGD